MHIKLPSKIMDICRTLHDSGFQAYVVGGALRDVLLGKDPHDWDITTDARPEEVLSLFPKTIPTGQDFGTITVVVEGEPIEVTTMRQEGRYTDYRHPDTVSFTDDIKVDLARRDFTINAMAYNPIECRFADPYKGRWHLKRRRLVCVGHPEKRFREDPLRMLRLVRFQAVLGFKVEKRTAGAIVPELVKLVSAERLGQELHKMLLGESLVPAFELFFTTGLLEQVIPELAACAGVDQGEQHRFDVLGHSIMAAQNVPPKIHLRWAALLHDVGKPLAREKNESRLFHGHEEIGAELAENILRRLRCSNNLTEKVKHLVRHHMYPMQPNISDKAVRHMISKVGAEHIFDLIDLRQADIAAMYFNPVQAAAFLTGVRQRVAEVLAQGTALSVSDLAINGHIIINELGIKPGPIVGTILNKLLEMVIEDPSLNNQADLLRSAKSLGSLDQRS